MTPSRQQSHSDSLTSAESSGESAQPQPILTPSTPSGAAPTHSSFSLSPNPSSCSVPVIASAITAPEIKLRERQIEILKEHERVAGGKNQAGVGTRLDVLEAERVRLNCEILLLQAKQLLEEKQNN